MDSPSLPVIADARGAVEAMAAARRQGSAVVVNRLTDEMRLVKAHPDGTMSAELAVRPVRVPRGDRWVDIDPTLVRKADGSVGPRAVTIDLAFSGGGRQPLVRMGVAGGFVALSWPGQLPAPELSGAVAIYRDVLPGVDLRLRADGTGYVKHLVVRTAEAAKNPALARIRLGLATQRLTYTVASSGGTEIRDRAGAVVMTGAAAVMWDNAASNVDSPGEGATVAPVKVLAGKGSLTLVPDKKLLRGAGTRFPLVIDPSEHTAARHHWTKVFSGKPTATNWDGTKVDGNEGKVGYCGWDYCNSIGTTRTYWMFDTSFLENRAILDSRFRATTNAGPDCDQARDHVLYKANTWDIGEGTDWNNQPAGATVGTIKGFKLGTSSVPGCGAHEVTFLPNNAVNQGGVTTYFLVAAGETDKYAWRRYNAESARLWVRWNTRPAEPLHAKLVEGVPQACENCAGKAYSSAASLTMQAYLHDPDGDQLYADWDVYGMPAGTETFVQTPLRPDIRLGSGNWHSQSLDQTKRHGEEMVWFVRARDGLSEQQNGYGPWVQGPGRWIVDRVGVANAPSVDSPTYPDDDRWHGGAGVPGDFTFRSNGVDDVNHFLWSWTYPPSTKAVANKLGGETTLTLTPPGDGPRDLYVRSVDKAGHEGPITTHRIYVRGGNGPLAQYSFEGNAKDTAFLGWRDATLHGGLSYTPGAVGQSMTFNGQDGHLTANPAVRADASFSVTAWAKIDHLDSPTGTVVSQGSDAICGFCLQYERTSRRWVFVAPRSETDSAAGYDFVRSTTEPAPGEWTHLAGVFDKFEGKMRLYVNGVLMGEVDRVPRWHGVGALRIGYARVKGANHSFFPGTLDEVKIYDRPISAAEVRAQVSHDNVQLGYWNFDDERDSRTAVNAVSGGAAGVLDGDASFVPGQVNGAVKIGASGSVSMGAPVIRTDQSFTVAAWLTVDADVAVNNTRTAISQDGTVHSGFFLGYRNRDGGQWEFYLPSADSATRPVDPFVHSGANSARVGQTAHVAAVYDAPAQQIRIYVDGHLMGTAPRTTGFQATGPLRVGVGRWANGPANQWSGTVDELRAYGRVLSAAELEGLVSRDAVAVGRWAFDGDLSAVPPRLEGRDTDHPVGYTGGQSTLPEPDDWALQLNGSNYVSTDHAVTSNRSFSVAAWARLDEAGKTQVLLSQDATLGSSFQLLATSEKKWAFALNEQVVGPSVQVGAWTHLAGTYNSVSGRAELYVNGVLAASRDGLTGSNRLDGQFHIGRSVTGSIDDVSVWSRPLFANEVKSMAGRDLSLAHQWRLDEPSGRNASDSVGDRRGALSGDAGFTVGRVGNAVRFDGSGDAVTTPGVDVRTDKAFTVTAWVKLGSDRCVCKTEAVGIPGKMSLGHVKDGDQFQWGAWYFEMPEPDGRVTKASLATRLEEVGSWVHLAGVYDPATKAVVLHVDAVRHDEGTLNTAWNSTGGVVMGRTWDGDVDDVRLYTGALDNGRLADLYNAYPAEDSPATLPAAAGHWKFDEGTGPIGADSSGHSLTATLKGGTTWGGGREGASLGLDGTTGFAETAGPVLKTERSFSASAWVYLTSVSGGDRTVLGQDGNRVSVFEVRFDAASKKWAVVVPDSDVDSPARTVLLSTETARPWDWIHLAVTYDATYKQLRLYVNGVLSAAKTGVTIQQSSGPLSIGRGRWNGANAGYFPQAIDDVRVFSGKLSGGEVRLVHDSAPVAEFGFYRFDEDSARDYNWRKHDATPTGGVTYGPGISGRAMYLDGTGSAVTSVGTLVDAEMDSFSISAWAKLSRDDRISTIASQDGERQSGWVLQYRPGLKRWVFGQAMSDSDGAPMVYAHSLLPPTLDRWTHVQGVFDYPARQLRVYVDGQLAGVRDDVTLWRSYGKLALGRAKENSAPSGFFHGAIDEVHIDEWEISDTKLAERTGWPLPQAGQIGRYVNLAGDRYTASTSGKPREGYHYQAALGIPAKPGPNTTMLYECVSGSDGYTSADAGCENGTNVGEIGLVYTVRPTNLETVPVYRCLSGADRYESRQEDCEGGTRQATLGYTLAYAPLKRHYFPSGPDHYTTVDGAPPAYLAEGIHGFLGLTKPTGAMFLYSCVQGVDQFVSTDAGCEGKTVIGTLGTVYAQPPAGVDSRPLKRCVFSGQRFTSTVGNCEGHAFDGDLGYILANPSTTTAEFSS
ncbi:hypothetical protein Pa4123_05720 [Phytohabitans aurantiacus]|uniref:LamG-like jellyroll fold domain-containing protein n=1 Tax=Phytohabitans aurantiacus TaxID=3016789 RepID=A0ABQ5QM13_9ACTN|nr:hypothetical protein Pa4123_05720 [Phytohabitans aurantiacus]